MAIVIRAAVPGDLASVDAILARSYPRLLKADYPPSVLVTALPLISRAQPALMRSGTYFVAEEDGTILAAGGWTPVRRSRQIGEVRHLVTDDRHLRRGLARSLVEHSIDTARAAGVRQFDCKATRTAEPFYAAMGFERLGAIDLDLAPGITFPCVMMRRAI